MKNILLISVMVLLTLTGCREGDPKDVTAVEGSPYEATTVDGCIDEQACFEYVFLREVIPNYDGMTDEELSSYRFKRWKDNLRVFFIESDTLSKSVRDKFKVEFKELADHVDDFTGKKIVFTKDLVEANTIIVLAKDRGNFTSFIGSNKNKFDSKILNQIKFGDKNKSIYRIDRDNVYTKGLC